MSETWYKCLECGEVFPVKTPHCHGNQYRKRKIPWEAVEMPKSYAELEAEVKRLREENKRLKDLTIDQAGEIRRQDAEILRLKRR